MHATPGCETLHSFVLVAQPRLWYKTAREAVTLERFHRAFKDGLMEYGMIRAVKKSGTE